MDNFVVRTPREPPVRIPSAAPVRHQQQRLTELKRVVRVDDIVEIAEELETASNERALDLLQGLADSPMDIDILRRSGIGKAVGALKKSENEAIKTLATKLTRKWKLLATAEMDSHKKAATAAKAAKVGAGAGAARAKKPAATGKAQSSSGKAVQSRLQLRVVPSKKS